MQKLLLDNDYFRSSDISLSSALCCLGYQIEAVDKQNPAKAIFLIRRDENLDELVKLYFTHQLKVEPLDFFNSLKEIKTRLYNV